METAGFSLEFVGSELRFRWLEANFGVCGLKMLMHDGTGQGWSLFQRGYDPLRKKKEISGAMEPPA